MERIVVAYIGENCEKFVEMSLKSVKDADAIVFVDGGSKDGTKEIVKKYANEFLHNEYNQIDKMMNGKQRNIYLNFIKERFPGWWCLVLDPDEIVDDFSQVKEFIQRAPKDFLYNIKMRHLIGDLGSEDVSLPVHFVPHRLFYVESGGELFYPEVEHPVLQRPGYDTMNQDMTTIWHLAYISGMWDIKDKYKNHMKKSQMHTEKFLKHWYHLHLFGRFPKRQINLNELPEILLNEFGIDKGEIYYASSILEAKHFVMAKQWISNWDVTNVLDLGCGFGHYGYVIQEFLNRKYIGFDINEWVVENTSYKNLDIRQGDITGSIAFPDSNYDLVLCVDILEHIEEKDLDITLKLISELGKHFIFSIPWIGNPDLQTDTTHKIFEEKDWWVEKLSKYFKIKDAPKDWMYSNQILIGEKK